ncbi:HAD-IIIA family hydrolase [Pelagicoccus sp. NFK12]|uniref:D,D-heptose 1,7-bisphosphate phosphatase n=1 Tax=Pelagicoccus enzymogenes TaxID=2773457 RepID=A0A927FCW6_9BACT|nr:HAD-IIIA family hydrolase [Pelagicoccus enzymogenes]MBD5781385.1 HAD-IIIA family hydrolase [Pelagicoccus enzymogenes]
MKSSSAIPQALFLDRDGTLIRWVHYLHDPDQVELLPGVGNALQRAKLAGCSLFLVTNQSGVGRGYFELDAVEDVNRRMFELLGMDSSFFDGICIATESPDTAREDSYRKPSPRYLLEQIEKRKLDPERCFMVGDRLSDAWTGKNAGVNSVLLPSAEEDRGVLPAWVVEAVSLEAFVADCF